MIKEIIIVLISTIISFVYYQNNIKNNINHVINIPPQYNILQHVNTYHWNDVRWKLLDKGNSNTNIDDVPFIITNSEIIKWKSLDHWDLDYEKNKEYLRYFF